MQLPCVAIALLAMTAFASGGGPPFLQAAARPPAVEVSSPPHVAKSSIEVLLLGTGYPRPDPARGGPATAIVAGGQWFVVDAGRGVTMRIAATSLRYDAMKAVFLTHLHSDHTAGLPDLFDTSWQFGRIKPLELFGPRGTERLSAAMLSFFADDIHYRRDLVEKHPAAGATIR